MAKAAPSTTLPRPLVRVADVVAEDERPRDDLDQRVTRDRVVGSGRKRTAEAQAPTSRVRHALEIDAIFALPIKQKRALGGDVDADLLIDLAGKILVRPHRQQIRPAETLTSVLSPVSSTE